MLARTTIAKAETEQVVRLRHLLVEADGLSQRLDRTRDVAIAVVGESQLVDDAGSAIIEAQTAFVVRCRRRVLAPRGMGVAEQLERPRGSGIE